ncbi:MAG: DUF6198 family protein [Ruminococcus sp.]
MSGSRPLGTRTHIPGTSVLTPMILRKKFCSSVPAQLLYVVGFVFGELLDARNADQCPAYRQSAGACFTFVASQHDRSASGLALSQPLPDANRAYRPFPREPSQTITSITYPKIKISSDVICLAVTALLTGIGLAHNIKATRRW